MKFEVQIAGRNRVVELRTDNSPSRWHVFIDNSRIEADVIEVAPNALSILLNGKSYEVRITPQANGTLTLQTGSEEFTAEVLDPRAWRGRRHGYIEAEGRQQITAPMPGKVIRVLVKPSDKVKAGQGILVVEAMKMQNEVRSPKTGSVERLLAQEGQPVNAGQVLAWID
jgi:biotin carboxyl carrier protein